MANATREIKFRAWNAEERCWLYWAIPTDVESDIHELARDMFFALGDPKTRGEYTGIKDKNDHEIYEGDILKYWYPLSKGLTKTGNVVWEGSEACWFLYDGFPNHDQTRLTASIARKSEVIGNIYEIERKQNG